MGNTLRAFRGAFVAVGSFSLAINVLLLVPAIYMLQMYDRVLTSRNEMTLYMLTLIMVGLFLLEGALEFVRARVLIRVSAAFDLRLGPRVFDATFQRYLAIRGGNPGQALTDLASVRQFVTGKGLLAFFDAPWMPIYLAVIFLLHPWLGLFALFSALLLLGMAYANGRATAPALAEAGRLSQVAGNYAASNLRNADAIEAMGMLTALRRRWFVRQSRSLAAQSLASDRAAVITAASRALRLILQSGILGAGALLVIDNQLTPGGMIAASILLGRALSPVDLAIANWRGFIAARNAYGKLSELLEMYPAATVGTSLPRPQGHVVAENLLVAAPGGSVPILKGVQFGVAAGMLMAVLGPTAAGKSTLARALVGVWQPLRGSVRLDNADVSLWSKAQLGPWIGYLPQDVELFEGTIAENIARFGEPDSGRIVQAAQRAGVHDMILLQPKGYDTPIGEGGFILSAGQRQRVALARALYGDPALIVLDEPNANLDEAGDAALLAALANMREERRTAIVMTHRLNVARIADVVLVLVEGRVRAYGPREPVMRALADRAKRTTAVEPPDTGKLPRNEAA